MPFAVNLSTTPGWRTDHGIVLEITGSNSLAKKRVCEIKNLDALKKVVADFGKEVHDAHPDESFYINVSIPNGDRSPNGFKKASNNFEFGEQAYMRHEKEKPSQS